LLSESGKPVIPKSVFGLTAIAARPSASYLELRDGRRRSVAIHIDNLPAKSMPRPGRGTERPRFRPKSLANYLFNSSATQDFSLPAHALGEQL